MKDYFDALTRDYLAEGPTVLRSAVLETALGEAQGQRQRRTGLRGRLVDAGTGRSLRLVTLPAVMVVVIAIALGSVGTAGPATKPAVSQRVAGFWAGSQNVVLTWRPLAPDQPVSYLAAVALATFHGDGWSTGVPMRSLARGPDTDLLAGTADWIDAAGLETVALEVTPSRPSGLVLAPPRPLTVDIATRLDLLGDEGWFSRSTRAPSVEPYVVIAAAPDAGPSGRVTAADLRAAGTTYPAGLLERYGRAAVPADAIRTPEARALIEEIASIGGDDPYDLATAAVAVLQDPRRFTYDADVRDLACGGLSVVDCFATYRRGYCEYYASTMAVLLRELGVPTRLVQGFLPGEPDATSGVWAVRESDAHAWVQVFFPGYGWIDFDPTGGGVARLAPVPAP